MGKQGETQKNKGKPAERGKTWIEKHEEIRKPQEKQENTQKHMEISFNIGDIIWSLT